jgi:AcrR family transcriptional regulator
VALGWEVLLVLEQAGASVAVSSAIVPSYNGSLRNTSFPLRPVYTDVIDGVGHYASIDMPRQAIPASMPSKQPVPVGLRMGDVVRAALELIDQHGVDGFSIRALRDRLGVGAPTIYWHVGTKADLLEAVVELVVQNPPATRADEGGWQDRLRRFFAIMREQLVAHPHVMELIRSIHSHAFERWVSEAVAIMHEAGFADADAADYARIAVIEAIGAARAEAGARAAMYMEPDPDDGRGRRYRVKPDLLSRDLPATVALTTVYDLDHQHELIVDIFIAGLEAKRAHVVTRRRSRRR